MPEETAIPDTVWKGALVSVEEEDRFHCMDMVSEQLVNHSSQTQEGGTACSMLTSL